MWIGHWRGEGEDSDGRKRQAPWKGGETLEGQQERRVQRETENKSRGRWSYFQSSEEERGCFVSSYRLRVIWVPQLCRPAVTHCYASLCPGVPASFCRRVSVRACACARERAQHFFFFFFFSPHQWGLLAWKWAGLGYLCGVNKYESLHAVPQSSRQLCYHLGSLPSNHPSLFLFLLVRRTRNTMKVWFLKAGEGSPCSQLPAEGRALLPDTRPICWPPPLPPATRPCRIRASITRGVLPQTATSQPTTCDSHSGSLWLWRGCVLGRERPKPWAGQATID